MVRKISQSKGAKTMLASTAAGRDWVMKALNPACPEDIVGIPDGKATSRVIMKFTQDVIVGPPNALAWTADIMLHSNPWVLAAIKTTDIGAVAYAPILNYEFGANEPAIRQNMYENFEAYRLAYASVTVDLDATDLYNSGTLAAAQYIYEPVPGSIDDSLSAADNTFNNRFSNAWVDQPRPYASLLQIPGCMTGLAKEGCYMPLKLDLANSWRKTNDLRVSFNTFDSVGLLTYNTARHFFNAHGAKPTEPSWPFGRTGTDSAAYGLEFRNCQDTIGHISLQNLDPHATLRMKYIYGFEFMVAPNTNYAMLLKTPPKLDQQAMIAYEIISRELAQAYPKVYNDFAKIVKIIGDIASTILPAIFPGSGVIVRRVADAANVVAPHIQAAGAKIISRVQARRRLRREARAARRSKT